MIFLTFGTGLGAGLILDSKLYSGASDMAGEIGHVRLSADVGEFLPVGYGKRGSAEGSAQAPGLHSLAEMRQKMRSRPALSLRFTSPQAETRKI